MSESFERLCATAREAGQHPELVTSDKLQVRHGKDRQRIAWRDLQLLRVTDVNHQVIYEEELRGLDDLDRAAASLLRVL